ncbi:hypothetical protein KA012_04520 [Candidatus Woesebacteria bacterium]|nr:hypothetical protein [Candidatus Woesebacteria bacterium]
MRKEVIISIILGLGLGFVITFGIYRTQVALRSTPSSKQQAESLKTPVSMIAAPDEQELAIHNPADGTITPEKTIVVTGTSEPLLPVVLLVNNTEFLSTTDDGGNFSFDVPLDDGSNVLTTYILLDDGSSFVDQRTIIMGDFNELIDANTATESAK